LLANLHTTSEGDKVGEGTVVELIGTLINGKFSNEGRACGLQVSELPARGPHKDRVPASSNRTG
jgi:hypothetical protein